MKLSIKFLAIVALVFTFNFAANAQRGDRQPPSPEKMAERQTTRMVEHLALSETQAAQVQQIHLAYAQKMHEARENNEGNREAMKEIRTAINTEKETELQQVLTAEQFQTYAETKAKRGKGRKGKGKGNKEGQSNRRA